MHRFCVDVPVILFPWHILQNINQVFVVPITSYYIYKYEGSTLVDLHLLHSNIYQPTMKFHEISWNFFNCKILSGFLMFPAALISFHPLSKHHRRRNSPPNVWPSSEHVGKQRWRLWDRGETGEVPWKMGQKKTGLYTSQVVQDFFHQHNDLYPVVSTYRNSADQLMKKTILKISSNRLKLTWSHVFHVDYSIILVYQLR